MTEYSITKDALLKLHQELESLKNKRKDLIVRIETALGHGDLSENFEYHEAKESQGLNEARIIEVEALIKSARVVEKTSSGRVGLGSKIKIEAMNKIFDFEIVSFNESAPSIGRISNQSPIGLGLIGHAVGDTVIITMPNGTKVSYKVLSVD